jgi:hypothetical protein
MRPATRSGYAPALLALTCLGTCVPTAAADPPDPARPRELTLSPAAAPVPALKYRLLPMSSELNAGDAAPIYMRLKYEIENSFNQGQGHLAGWLEMPLDKLPVQEARQLDMSGRLKLLALGARREFCDWSYPLPEQRQQAFDILLPELQSMRVWGRFLALKARLDLVEHKYGEAVETLESGIAFSRHVGSGPFLLNSLVGITICNGLVDRIEELVEQPLAPNLYWALTALPRPLVGTRRALEFERRMPEDMMPEFTQLDSPRTPAEWESLLSRMYARMQNLATKLLAGGLSPEADAAAKAVIARPLEAFKKEAAPKARDELAAGRGLAADRVRAMSDDEVLCRSLVAQYHVLQDRVFKAIYLPYPEAIPVLREAEAAVKDVNLGPLQMVNVLQPAVAKSLAAETRLDRRIAALRVVEAIRLHAAALEGKLPESLSQLTEVPVPEDPATGRPFEYHLENGRAILSGPAAGIDGPAPQYRITIRTKDRPAAP